MNFVPLKGMMLICMSCDISTYHANNCFPLKGNNFHFEMTVVCDRKSFLVTENMTLKQEILIYLITVTKCGDSDKDFV